MSEWKEVLNGRREEHKNRRTRHEKLMGLILKHLKKRLPAFGYQNSNRIGLKCLQTKMNAFKAEMSRFVSGLELLKTFRPIPISLKFKSIKNLTYQSARQLIC